VTRLLDGPGRCRGQPGVRAGLSRLTAKAARVAWCRQPISTVPAVAHRRAAGPEMPYTTALVALSAVMPAPRARSSRCPCLADHEGRELAGSAGIAPACGAVAGGGARQPGYRGVVAGVQRRQAGDRTITRMSDGMPSSGGRGLTFVSISEARRRRASPRRRHDECDRERAEHDDGPRVPIGASAGQHLLRGQTSSTPRCVSWRRSRLCRCWSRRGRPRGRTCAVQGSPPAVVGEVEPGRAEFHRLAGSQASGAKSARDAAGKSAAQGGRLVGGNLAPI